MVYKIGLYTEQCQFLELIDKFAIMKNTASKNFNKFQKITKLREKFKS